ncbi:sporulation protein YtaF [Thermoanaerobacterium xylanolyticum LX-11]|uniref:Sporulation protein YtaF n=1 Tax=Thermoanaerobacterium xylanolyticum (strain ATCC 49914 / DSM 7097 / LX-11) TaxID=858215 RepID=F6BJE0_THEXL|nr:sporulation membrane protein YtaF [Thermoanaerobacterium xylanolyticum]AEF16908.1 sporulation protein YtaF [Thermoanaerobacterium xylanolyticum LX-11]
MHVISSLLFSISANIDNFTVAIAYGIKKIRIGILSNILIALVSGIGTFLSMSIGLLINRFLPTNISNIVGSLILIMLGLWFILDYYKKRKTDTFNFKNNYEILINSKITDMDNSKYIDMKESIILAFGLTINNLGLGIGASITGLNIYFTTLLTIIFSLLSILLGFMLGNTYLAKIFGNYAPLVSGILIVFLGIYEIFI